MYKVEGYDKDNGVYVNYWNGPDLEMAKEIASTLYKIVKRDELIRYKSDGSKEPIDWILVSNDKNEIVYVPSNMRQKIRNILDEIYKESTILPENFDDGTVNELVTQFINDGYEITKENVIEEILWCYMCKVQ